MTQMELKQRKRGASARPRQERAGGHAGRVIRVATRLGLTAFALTALGAAGYYGQDFVERASERPIKGIGVQGQFAYVSQQAISNLVTPMIVDGFLQLPLSAIKEKLESNPWIAQAAVSRRWPDELFISITEEQPIARWGKLGFLNHRGELIRVEGNSRLDTLPLLSGSPGQEKTVMQSYQQLAQTLGYHGLKISEFYSDELLCWNLVLSNGLRINIGRDQTMDKIQRFLVVYERELHRRLDEVAGVDLRYSNGLAVEWKSATADSQEAVSAQEAQESDKKV